MGILAFAATALHAQAVQFNVTGQACTFGMDDCAGPVVPFTASFDVVTRPAQLSANFFTSDGVNCLTQLQGMFKVTNFSAQVGGQRLPFIGLSTGGLLLHPFSNCTSAGAGYLLTLGAGLGGFTFHLGLPDITQAQYQAFKNPLFSVLTSLGGLNGGIDGGAMGNYTLLSYVGQVSRVPEPGALMLLLLGLAALYIARRRRAA